jgi:uncharacterized protein
MDRVAARSLAVRSGDVELAGSLWLPVGRAAATLLMHPGSGPSDRDNDVYFPEIREHLLAAGIAVASFDKRGVGGSSGDWTGAGIVEQATDAAAALEHLASLGLPRPFGLFGHSQGGWVVLEAASGGAPADVVIANSGPGVSPAVQDRYALHQRLQQAGLTPAETASRLDAFDAMAGMLRSGVGFDAATAQMVALGADDGVGFVAGDARQWELSRAILDHDPRPAMRRIGVPVLALFGAEDHIVPVEQSVEVYRAEVRADLLTVAVLPGGDHRVQSADPPRLVDGYAPTLVGFILDATP